VEAFHPRADETLESKDPGIGWEWHDVAGRSAREVKDVLVTLCQENAFLES